MIRASAKQSLKFIGIWVSLVLLSSFLVNIENATGYFPPLGQQLFWGPSDDSNEVGTTPHLQLDTSEQDIYGVWIDFGKIGSFKGCDDRTFGRDTGHPKGFNDLSAFPLNLYTASDLYVVTHNTENLNPPTGARFGAPSLTDRNGIPNVVVIPGGSGIFERQFLGIAGSFPGKNDIIYDECQDGRLDHEDAVFSDALTVNWVKKLPFICKIRCVSKSPLPPNGIHDIKEMAQRYAFAADFYYIQYKVYTIIEFFQTLRNPFEIAGNIQDFVTGAKRTVGTLIKIGFNLDDLSDVPDVATNQDGQILSILKLLSKKFHGIERDPPDNDFKQFSTLDLGPYVTPTRADNLSQFVIGAANELHNEQAIAGSLLSSLERYQGAQIEESGEWGIVHASEIRDYSNLLINQISTTNDALERLKMAVSKDSSLEQTALVLQQIQDGLRSSGFTNNDTRDFKNAGLSDQEIGKVMKLFVENDFSFSKSMFNKGIDDLIIGNEKFVDGLSDLAEDTDNIVQELKSDPTGSAIDIPIARAGGPYSGQADLPVTFDGRSSTSKIGNITLYEWDIDGDGVFNDTTGPLISHTYSTPHHGLIGLKVTNDMGYTDIAYTFVTISGSNNAPSVLSSSPNSPAVNITVGKTLAFNVTVSDSEPLRPVQWKIDGQLVNSGTSFTYSPNLQNIGLHLISATVENSHGKDTRVWSVATMGADSDLDHWNSNIDCNDSDPNINSGMKEIHYNGIDDDCNPSTLDDNTPPISDNRTFATIQNQTSTFVLTGTDIDNDPLTFSVVKQPENGTLGNVTNDSEQSAIVDYKPKPNFHGVDKFIYVANDGNGTSSNATVNVSVGIADSPVAHDQTVVIDENSETEIELTATSPDGHPLQFSIVGQKAGGATGQPSVGTVKNFRITGPYSANVTYFPGPNFATDRYGFNDSLIFRVNDGAPVPQFEGREFSQGLVTIKVNDVNNPPDPLNKVVSATENKPVNITLRAADADNDFYMQGSKYNHGLTFSIVKPPLHGIMGQITTTVKAVHSPPQFNDTEDAVMYTPNPGFLGRDTFTFKANDGSEDSTEGNVTIIVKLANQTYDQFEDGDVIVGTLFGNPGDGPQWYKSDGAFVKTMRSSVPSLSPTYAGGAFGSSGNLYVTEFGSLATYPGDNLKGVSIYNKTGGFIGGWGNRDDFGCIDGTIPHTGLGCMLPESLVSDKSNNFYVGGIATQAGEQLPPGDHREDIRKFDSNGNLLDTFDVAVENRGSDWIELGPDQCTMYYTSEDIHIKRYNVCTHSQMADFANVYGIGRSSQDLGGARALPNYALRLLPDGGIIVASQNEIWRLDSGGNLVQRYDAPGEHTWFALNLDPDGKSFWSASNGEPDIYRFNLDSGKIIQHFRTHNDFGISGIYIKGEPIVATTEFPPTVFSQNLTTNKNIPLAINLTGFDIANDQLDFSIESGASSGVLSGITKLNNNISRVIYTPNIDFQGSDSFTFKANDGKLDSNNTGTVDITVNHEPIAFDDIGSTLEGKNLNIPILANDTDEDSDNLSIAGVNTSSLLGDVMINNGNGTITYIPLETFTGQDSFNYTVSDGHGANDSAQVVVSILSKNSPPIANSQNVITSENIPINITLTGSDPNGDDLLFSRFSGPANGFITKFNSSTGILQYAPLSYFHGNDSFSFRVSDGKTKSIPAIVNITVPDNGINDPPNAISERTSTERNKPVLIDVLSNDKDPNGDLLTIANITGPINGTTIVNPNETITFVPMRNFNGSDAFFYNVTDGNGGSDIAQVIIDVRSPAVNPPTVQDQSSSTDMNMPLNITLTGTSPSGGALTFSIIDKAAHGNLSGISPVNNTAARLVYIPTINFTGSDLFTFKANNGTVDSNIGTVTIAVNGSTATNTPPIARDDFANTNEDKPVVIPVLANDTDIDGDILAVDSIKLLPTNGTSVINPNGTLTYSPNTNFFGTDGFNYTITDGKGGNVTARVLVIVNPVNDPPLTSNDIATTLQDKPVVINVLANDTDPEGDALVISAITNPPSNGTAIINNNGTITFTAPTGFSGSDTFYYQVSDGNGGNSTGSVLVNVIAAVNKPPVVSISSPINGSQFTEGDPVAFSGSATDPEDGNISSVMTWESSIDGPLGIGPNIVVSSLSQGTHSITASAIDSGQLSNSSSIEIIVHDFNEPPVAVADHFETNEDTPFNMNVIANDTDPDNDALTISAIKQIPNNGQASINSNNTINYEPNQNFNGQDSLIYTIADGVGGNSSAQALIDVLEINDNPIARNDSTVTNKNTAVSIDVLANDTDVDNDPLTISQVTTPAHGSASIENAKIKYTPNSNFVGIDEFEYIISDGRGGNAKASVAVNVKSVNQLPVATDGSASTNENILLKMKLNASDPDNDPLTYIIDTQPTHGSISAFHANNGTLTYTPQSNFTGQDSLKFKVNDGTSDSNIATVVISVNNVNHPPISEDQNVVTNINKQIEITLKGHDPDASNKITFVKVTDPSHGTIAGFDKETGKLTYIPNNGFSGPDSFLFKVIDSNKAESNIATVSITVNAVLNKPPVASNINVETSQDTAKVITLLGTDPDAGDKITYHIVSAASSGSVSSIDQTSGKVTYTPNKGFLGLDSFTYQVTDLSGANSNIATVGITVKSTSSTPYPLPPSCSPNDKSGGKALRGTNSDDVIVGTEAADSIQGLSGNDAINGCGASDNLNGNAGNDGIAGGTNEDNIHGNNGNDYLRGDAGNDALYGGEGDDVLVGGPGRDSFYCGSGNDKVLDFNAKDGDALQKQSNTRGRDATQKSDCENVFSVSGTSTSAKSTSQALLPTPTQQISPRDDRNQSQTLPSQSQQSTQKGQNGTSQSPENSQPTVTDYTVSIDKNQGVSIILPGNDNDGDKLLFKIINKPQNAIIGNFKASSGSLTYTPSKDYVGDDKFTFTVNDGKTDGNIGTVTIHVKDTQTIVEQQTESQSSENQVKPFPPIYWRGNLDKTEKLLPLNVGNLTVDSADQVTKVLKISPDNHNIYDNIAAHILTAKFNIKNEIDSCEKVNEAIKYGDEILHSVNYQGAGTAMQELSDPQMKSMIKAYSILTQFNIRGCAANSPTDMILAPGIFEILYFDPLSFFVN